MFLTASILTGISISETTSHIWSTPSLATDYKHGPNDYGVDYSYPIHYPLDNTTWHAKRYNEMMEGCFAVYSQAECMETERGRLKMSLEQPRTQYNYTEMGFKKIRAPRVVFEALKQFYEENKENRKEEVWSRAYTYTNHWTSPSYMISVEDTSYPTGGQNFKEFIWNNINPVIEDWIGGYKLRPTSLYGIRVYTNNSVLATHVDRLPLVSSCIINVAQEDMAEPWLLEVYDHAGKAHNVTMEPGDLVLYESSTVLHGRPFPMNGRNYANIFIHFEPENHHDLNAINFPTYELGQAAAHGDLRKVMRLVSMNPESVNERDYNGWEPIHEASRAGKLEVLKYLIEKGADKGSLTNSGGSPLWWAKRSLNRGHKLIQYLEEIGAPEVGQEEHEEL